MGEWIVVKLKFGDDLRWEAIPDSWIIRKNGQLTGFCWWTEGVYPYHQPLPMTPDKLWQEVAIISQDMFGFSK